MASLTMTPEDRASIEAFRSEVLEASLTNLVLVRFTAEWCGPCKQLAPMMEKAVAEAGAGRTKQVAIDIDTQRLIADQFRIQSVPAVFAFVGGRPVDGFVGVKSEREIKAMIEKLLTALPPTEEEVSLDTLVESAFELLNAGETDQALQAFSVLNEEAPEREDIKAGFARVLLTLGELDAAETVLGAVPADSKDAAIVQARAALDLAKASAQAIGQFADLQAKIEADPNDHQSRIDLANALFASGELDQAADQLLASIAADRDWNEGAARAQLLKLIDAKGFGDPWSIATRRKLSHILFA